MDWTHLGHAGWLAEAGRLRLLFDPLLDDPHQGGTYVVWPPRRIHVEALRPDVVFVTHAHADHFDVRSLARLAQLDPETVVVTPDPLVSDVAGHLGFRVVRRIAAGHALDLDGVRVVLTPSRAPEPEWGAMVETRDGVVWNQVDTVLSGVDEVRRVAAEASSGRGVDLALVRWAPLLEIEAQVPGSLAFPFEGYADLLDQIAAVGARTVVPAAAGQRHATAPWLDRIVLPVTPDRARRDLVARHASAQVLDAVIGATYRVRGGHTELDPVGGRRLVTPTEPDAPDPRRYRPLDVPPLIDGATPEEEAAALRVIVPWIRETLAPALTAAWPTMRTEGTVHLGLEVVAPSGSHAWTFVVEARGTTVHEGLTGDLDVLDAITATALRDVLEARRAWGHVLLAGELRASDRAYRVTGAGVVRPPIAPIFLYYALPYLESARRAVWREVEALTGRPAAARS